MANKRAYQTRARDVLLALVLGILIMITLDGCALSPGMAQCMEDSRAETLRQTWRYCEVESGKWR